ncbi:RNA methyltransferase [Methylonatrum kenyense]|uniref:RNA methyltransferase n=1 Tax=Methylonatrum kenyense TaxID=455253 RepID=UPI0020BE2FCF|nr:RNA methyltransferase [Methylonatrum kenyense]MCK8515506.1 RNA methyltransferase [Methylonatrum kenyense]
MHVGFTLILLLVGSVLLAGCESPGRATDAALLLGDVRAGAEDSRLKRRTETPERQTVRYEYGDEERVADLYRSGDSARGRLILVHGFTEQGRRDPRLVEFAHSMARIGFEVIAPEVPGLTDLSISQDESRVIADTVRHASDDGAPVALAAISFAVGPAMLAAMEEDTAEAVDIILAVGPYYDLVDVIRYASTGDDPGLAEDEDAMQPRPEGRWIILLAQRHRLDDANDRSLLREIGERRLENPRAEIEDLADQLGADGRALLELVRNEDPEAVDELIAALPSAIRDDLSALNLAERDLSPLRARMILIHGPEDRVIPISHSERLRQALPEGQARLYRAGGLDHVDVSTGFFDGIQLWRATRHLLRLADERGRE